jgi:NADH-quinone oxidoreductase subunit N
MFWCLALFSMLCGNLAALVQTGIKRMLAWSSVAQMGYAAMGLVAAPAGGLRAAAFYVVLYGAAGLATFGAVAVLSDGNERDRIEEYRGLGYERPLAGAALAVGLFSLAGIPPAAGFMAKFAVFSAALRGDEATLAIAGILTALVAVFFYLRVVVTLYMRPAEGPETASRPLLVSEIIALGVPTAVTLFLGVYPSPLLELLGRIVP